METLIVQTEDKEQIQALKVFLHALKVRFEARKEKPKNDFSELAGKLSWKGDALAEQKRLRAEWD